MTPWRTDPNGQYWFVGTDLTVYPEVDARDAIDNGRYEAGNYFATRTQAVKVATWIYAGMQYIRGSHMETAIARLIEARRTVEHVATSRREL